MSSSKLSEKEIQKVIENWAQAIRDINMDEIYANHPKDIVMFDVAPPLQSKGMEAYKKTWDLFFKYSKGGEGSFELVELEITSCETVAFCHALLKIGGKEPQCRLTLGLKKVNDQWLIVHEHHSAPSAAE